jgi:hypothetical protein
MAKNPSFDEFFDKTTGQRIFTDGSAKDRLAATLNPSLTNAPTNDQARAFAEKAARDKVDASWPTAQMKAAADRVIAASKAYNAAIAKAKYDMRPDPYLQWRVGADEAFAQELLDETIAFRGVVESATKKTQPTPMPFPVTSVDIAALALRLNQFDSASPAEAQRLVDDAVLREDKAFLVQAGSNVRSWLKYRNSWQSQDAQDIANSVLDTIAGTSNTADNVASDYAEDKAATVVQSWTALIGLAQGAWDPTAFALYQSTGALAGLYEPENPVYNGLVNNSSIDDGGKTFRKGY